MKSYININLIDKKIYKKKILFNINVINVILLDLINL